MKLRVIKTFHFEQDGPGDAPDEGHIRSGIDDIINLLQLAHCEPPLNPIQARAVKAMTEGFTAEQWGLFDSIVERRAEQMRDTAEAMPEPYKAALVGNLESTMRRWKDIRRDLKEAMTEPTVVVHTGLTESRSDREKSREAA